ncbi:restriction endonuclease subunit S [Halomonas salipaludis]|nr:restriction endonuclease subunit S [Halomonas salipaludis]
MSEWTTIAELADTNPGSLPANTDRGFRFRYIDLGSVDDGAIDWQRVQYISYKDAPSRARRVCITGDALFGTVRPNLQSHGYVPGGHIDPLVASTGFTVIRAHEDVADGRYIFFSLLSENILRQSVNAAVGSNYPAVTDRDVRQFRLFAPPVEQQSKIADVLASLDTQIQKTEALIAKLEKVKEGLLQDLLTRGIDENGQLRPSPEQAPELYKDSPLGLIPISWEIRNLDQIADVVDPQPDHRTPPAVEDGVPYVGIGDFDSEGAIDTASCRKVSFSAYEKQKSSFSVTPGDIIYGKIGTLGRPKKLPNGTYALSANVVLIQPSSYKALLFYALNSSRTEKQILDITNTTSQPALGIEKVRKLLFPIPELGEAEEISIRLEKLSDCIQREASRLISLNLIKQGLMDDLLTGRVRVTPLLDQAQATTPA